MIVLGLDCASKQSSVCIKKDGKVMYRVVQATATTHSQNLLPMVADALEICGLAPKDVDLYAVTVGPGSFTGLRIGLAVIKGMASANNTPCIGVSSLKSLAVCTELSGTIIPAFDARRNQVYACVTENGNVICDDFCEDVHYLEEYVKNSTEAVYFIGDGKELCYKTYRDYPNVKPNNIEVPCIAMGACLLAEKEYADNGAGTHFDLTPSYLRLSQAEREMKEKMEAKQ